MKTGMKSIEDLRQTISINGIAKKDFLVKPEGISVEVREPVISQKVLDILEETEENDLLSELLKKVTFLPPEIKPEPHLILNDGDLVFRIGKIAHENLRTKLKIPAIYYNRCLEQRPELLATQINSWLHDPGYDDNGKRIEIGERMVRTLFGTARAVLSNRYRPLDNFDLMLALQPILDAQTDLFMESCDVTERHFYLKMVSDRLKTDRHADGSKIGDVMQAGFCITNSEVGCSSLRVEPLIFKLSCRNGAIMADRAMRKYHIGRITAGSEGAGAARFFSDATRQADDKAFFMKVKDVVEGSLSEASFQEALEIIKTGQQRKIEGGVQETVDKTAKEINLSGPEADGLLKHLAEGGDMSQWGMVNAVTLMSQDVSDYDRATQLERAGGSLLQYSEADWKRLSA